VALTASDDVRWELYDVEADRSESHDLAEKYPDRVAEMSSSWRAYAERAEVLPWPRTR
jgi:arylsulfatase